MTTGWKLHGGPVLPSRADGACRRPVPAASRSGRAPEADTARAVSAELGMAPGRFRWFVRKVAPAWGDRVRFTPEEMQWLTEQYHSLMTPHRTENSRG